MIDAGRIARLSALSGFGEADCQALGALLIEKQLSHGEAVWTEPNLPEGLAFILEGKVELSMDTEFPERRVVMGIFSAGTVIGEIGAFCGDETRLTAMAAGRTVVAMLPVVELGKLSADNPSTYQKLLLSVLKVTSKRLLHAYERMSSVF